VTIVPAAPRGRTPEARPISTEPSAGETPTWQEYRR